MFSVNSFYYVLQQNLLGPLKINGRYFYPYGSWSLCDLPYTNTLSITQFNPLHDLQLLFWDQEPFNIKIYPEIIKQISTHQRSKYTSIVYSDINKITKSNPLNWYYFFHGFAALDWYRDAKYLSNLKNNNFTKLFISMNRLTNQDRSYRLGLVADLISRGIDQNGAISCSFKNSGKELTDTKSKLPMYHKELLTKLQLENVNLRIDYHETPGAASALLGFKQIKLFQDSFIHLVTETLFYGNNLHLTEKIFKPIAVHRPFILAGGANNLSYLKTYGFETFSTWWDESYDLESDDCKRMIKIVDVLEKLSKYSKSDLKDMHNDMLPVLKHNHDLFFNKFKKIIVSELLNNFVTMLDNYNKLQTGMMYDYSIINFNELTKRWSSI
jgi:hypothetical protein